MKAVKTFLIATWVVACMFLPGIVLFTTVFVADQRGWLKEGK